MISDKKHFLNNIWQKKPVFIKQALADIKNIIDGDELAGLACEELAESRIISGFGLNNKWSCQQGPFTEQDFSQLAETRWTLLVQGVDQWIGDIHQLLDTFNFLPRWRLEDIMASYAPIEGGVGPHFDYYDVFLIQVSGTREWKLGQHCDENSPLQHNNEVKLLHHFETQTTHNANIGDVLYIPAGVAHWGTATSDNCITLSVGFRAPSEKEILNTALDNIISELPENQRYQDDSDAIAKNIYHINSSVHTRLKAMLTQLTPEKIDRAMQQAFGQLVTESRYTSLEEESTPEDNDLLAILKSQESIELFHPPHSRFAFSEEHVFINGEAYLSDAVFSEQICSGKITTAISDQQLTLLLSLLKAGDIELIDS